MKLNRALSITLRGLMTAMLVVGAGLGTIAAAQTARRTPVRRARVQTAPTRDRIVEIQNALAREGFYSGKPSGRWDSATSKAMREFQTSKGLTPTGKLGAQSLQKLGLGSEVAGLAAPAPQANARPSAMSESELDDPGLEEPEEPSAN